MTSPADLHTEAQTPPPKGRFPKKHTGIGVLMLICRRVPFGCAIFEETLPPQPNGYPGRKKSAGRSPESQPRTPEHGPLLLEGALLGLVSDGKQGSSTNSVAEPAQFLRRPNLGPIKKSMSGPKFTGAAFSTWAK